MNFFITEDEFLYFSKEFDDDETFIIDIRDNRIKFLGKKLTYEEEYVKYIYENFFTDVKKEKKIKAEGIQIRVLEYIKNGFYIVKNTLEFLEIISKGNNFNIYRGHRNSAWDLIPSIHRKRKDKYLPLKDHEMKLYKNIRKQNLDEFKEQPLFINEVIKMQHYEIPTPLLDWTKNPLIALFFATSSGDTKDDGKVFMVNYSEQDIIKFDSPEYKGYSNFLKKIYVENNDLSLDKKEYKEKCIFLETINENNRLKVQKGLFSLDISPYLRFENIPIYEQIYNIYEKIVFCDLEKLIKNKDKELTGIKELLKSYLRKEENYLMENSSKKIIDLIIKFFNNFRNIVGQDIIENMNIFSNNEKEKTRIISQLESEIKKIKELKYNHEVSTKSIIILNEYKKNIRKELEQIYGIDSSTVYPDVQGYINYIKENF